LTINRNYAILTCNERAECYSGPYCYETEPVRDSHCNMGRPPRDGFFINGKNGRKQAKI
jgi:hypothetical protein